ncbi:MAG: GntR family transcriptional regulator [Syntrophales bacterium]
MLPAEANRVFEEIKSDIINGTYGQGEPLAEIPLSKKFGVNRARIHQVLDELEKMSLVEKVPAKGAFVKVITSKDLQEIFELKEAIDGMATRLAARRRNDDDLAQMIALFEEARRSFSDTDFERKIQIGYQLHQFILKSCDNARIVNTIKPLEFQIMRIWKTGIHFPERINKAFNEHIDILMAIREKDEERAESRMKFHMSSAFKDYISLLTRR